MTLEREVLSCCATTYSHPLARWLLGDSLHPGGLALTSRLARLAGVGPESTVLDAGSGLGATAVHLAETTGCRVVGVALERAGIEAGEELARSHGVEDRVSFLQGDLLEVELRDDRYDVALMECVLSILPRKGQALRRLIGALRPGGHLATTDVTVSGPLPQELRGALAIAGCVGDALSLEDYGRLLEEQGLLVDAREELGETAASTLGKVNEKLAVLESFAGLGKLPLSDGLLTHGKRVLAAAHELVLRGTLSYGLLVARRPEAPTGASVVGER